MAIVKMKHLRLMAMQQDRDRLLHLLQSMGCVEIVEPQTGDDPAWSALSSPDTGRLTRARECREQGERALTVLDRHIPKGGRSKERRSLTRQELLSPDTVEAGQQAAQKVLEAERNAAALQARLTRLEEERAALAPWLSLDVPLDIDSTREMSVQLGTLPASLELGQAEGRLLEQTPLARLFPASGDAEHHHLLLAYHNSVHDTVMQTMKELGWARANLKDYTGTAQDNDLRLATEISQAQQQLEQQLSELAKMDGARAQLQQLVDGATVEMDREESRCRLVDTESTFFMEGWLPVDSEQAVSGALSDFVCAWEMTDPQPEEYERVPVKLKNNWFTRPLNMVTEMYVYPAYDGVDPNPLMAPFFILFFGLMMADMAYGLLMLLGGWFLLKKLRATGTMGHMGGLLVLCGVSTLIFGALTGGFLGDFIPQIAKLIDPNSNVQLPYLFTPLTDTLAILIGSLALGVIQIITGMAISVVYKFRNGDGADAFWNEITWWVVLAGAALAIAGIGSVGGYPVVLLVGLVMLVYGSTRNAKGFGKVTALIGSVYNGVSGYFSDILSYARLMALMLAGAVIAQVFNTLGSVTGNVVVFVIISLIGNALNLALNLLGCYVHDLRLQCLEFFGRFYKEGGQQFRPMAYHTKYVDIKEEM